MQIFLLIISLFALALLTFIFIQESNAEMF